MRPLSAKQKKVLGSLANQAFRRGCGGGLSYDEFRHETTANATGLQSWRDLGQEHYVPLCNAFRAMLGLPPMQDNTPRSTTEARLHTLRDRIRHWECPAAYWAKIIRERFGRMWVSEHTPLEVAVSDFSDTELKHLIMTLENRCREHNRKESAALGIPPAVEVHSTPATMPPPRLAAYRGDILTERRGK